MKPTDIDYQQTKRENENLRAQLAQGKQLHAADNVAARAIEAKLRITVAALEEMLSYAELMRDRFKSEEDRIDCAVKVHSARDLLCRIRAGEHFPDTNALEIVRLGAMYGKCFMVARELLDPGAYQMFIDEMDKFRAELSEKESARDQAK